MQYFKHIYSARANKAGIEHLREKFVDFQPRPWQQELLTITTGLPDARKFYWYYDHRGNTGKSYFTDYLVGHHNAAVFTSGKMADIALAYKQEPIVVFDLTRTQADKMDHVYALIEGFKNGRLFSPKYDSQVKISARKLLHEAVVGASGESDTRARVLGFLQKREAMRLHALHHLVYRAHSILAEGAPPGSSLAPARELVDHPWAMLRILLSWALGSCSLPLDTDSLLEAAQEHRTPYVGRHLLTLGKLLIVACEERKAGVCHSHVEDAGDRLQQAEKVLRCAVRVLAVCHGKEVSSFIFEAASQLSLCE